MRLIDADALLEYCNNLQDKTIDANDIARFPTAAGWISVEDRLPEDTKQHILGGISLSDVVLVCLCEDNGKRFMATDSYVFKRDMWLSELTSGHLKATHWMPLPELPEEGDRSQ